MAQNQSRVSENMKYKRPILREEIRFQNKMDIQMNQPTRRSNFSGLLLVV